MFFSESKRSANLLRFLAFILAIGLFVQLSGKVWLESNSAQNAQVYIWLLLPAAMFLIAKIFYRKSLCFDPQYMPWLCFLLWVAMSVLWSSNSDDHPFSLMKRGVFIALYIVAIMLLMRVNENVLRMTLLSGVAIIGLGALVSLVNQFIVLDNSLAYRAFRIDRSGIGDFANYGWPVAAGIFHGAAATWALGFALDKRVSRTFSVLWGFIFSVLAVYVFFTYTRGAWFGLMASSVTVVILQNSRRGWVFLGACTLAFLAATLLLWDYLLIEATERQLSGRGPIWQFFFSQMPGHWLIGHGLGTPFNYEWPGRDIVSPHAHSLYFQQIYDSGLISLVFMALGLFGIAYKSWSLRSNSWVCLAFPALIFALVSMLTDVERIFTRPGDYWTVFWLPISILLAIRPPKNLLVIDKPT